MSEAAVESRDRLDGVILQLADLALLSQMRGAGISDASYPIRRVLLAMLGVCGLGLFMLHGGFIRIAA